MNGLFQSARRTLAWGLLIAASLVGVVVAKGIHPEVLVAFKSAENETLLADEEASDAHEGSGPEEQRPPEHFAQADSGTRLDVVPGFQTPSLSTSPRIQARRLPVESEPSVDPFSSASSNSVVLPPLPDPPLETAEQPQGSTGPVFDLWPPPAPDDAAQSEDARAVPVPFPGPENAEAAETEPSINHRSAPRPQQAAGENGNSQFIAQLTALQEQLNRIAATQEQQRTAQQSGLDAHYQRHQQQLEQKLAEIETRLRTLQVTTTQPARATGESNSTGVTDRQDRVTTTSPRGQRATPATVRQMLESLAEKSNLNLTLSINVEGDVEMNVQDPQSFQAHSADGTSPGYTVEKNGQKIQIQPREPQRYQREAFLPPIIKNPASTGQPQ